MDSFSTILALSSSPGRSLRALVRMSGPHAAELLASMCESDPSASHSFKPNRISLDHALLPVLLSLRRAPSSYTGEDLAEVQLPGNPDLIARLINALLARAADLDLDVRPAEPGEFTARAFLNGRIGLTQAEGVAAIIAAQSDAQLRAAQLLRSGAMADFAIQLADDLASALALVEAGIDFTDQEDVVAITPADLHDRLTNQFARLSHRLERSLPAEHLQSLPRVVIVGPPNAGKSSLFNALLNHERAVVSNVPGTTRDVLVEPIHVPTSHGPAEILLIDLAGLDEPETALDAQMQSAARAAIESADLIMLCEPADSAESKHQSGTMFTLPARTPVLVVKTKSDLLAALPAASPSALYVSARSSQGLDSLREALGIALDSRAVSLSAEMLVLLPRHRSALESALSHYIAVIERVSPQRLQHALNDPELIASELRAALDQLSMLAGEISSEDILSRIFSRFCIGK
ncbi:MAG TPA: GTPase [Phycisphaerales bacterium]|nr:GTPase [Phycisphaerales bacterium]